MLKYEFLQSEMNSRSENSMLAKVQESVFVVLAMMGLTSYNCIYAQSVRLIISLHYPIFYRHLAHTSYSNLHNKKAVGN